MTEPVAQNPVANPRLVRPYDSTWMGVATALARTTGTDVVLWRVLFVVLTLFGGLGLGLYLLGVVAIPAEGVDRSLAERLVHGPDRRLSKGEVFLLAVVTVMTAGVIHGGDVLLPALVLGGLYLLARRGRVPAASPPAALSAPLAPGATAVGNPVDLAKPAVDVPAGGRPWQPPQPRQRSVLGPLTVSVALVMTGVLLVLSAAGVDGMTAERIWAAALGTVGAGLVAGAWWGRSRGLIPLALVLALGLGGTVVARPAIDYGIGERTWRPVATSGALDYRLGVGEGTLDLRGLSLSEGQELAITARVDVGHLLVLVPAELGVTVNARAQVGDLLIDGTSRDGRDVRSSGELGPGGSPRVRLDLSVRTGQVEVRRG